MRVVPWRAGDFVVLVVERRDLEQRVRLLLRRCPHILRAIPRRCRLHGLRELVTCLAGQDEVADDRPGGIDPEALFAAR